MTHPEYVQEMIDQAYADILARWKHLQDHGVMLTRQEARDLTAAELDDLWDLWGPHDDCDAS